MFKLNKEQELKALRKLLWSLAFIFLGLVIYWAIHIRPLEGVYEGEFMRPVGGMLLFKNGRAFIADDYGGKTEFGTYKKAGDGFILDMGNGVEANFRKTIFGFKMTFVSEKQTEVYKFNKVSNPFWPKKPWSDYWLKEDFK